MSTFLLFIGTGWLFTSLAIAPLFDRDATWYGLFVLVPVLMVIFGLMARAIEKETAI